MPPFPSTWSERRQKSGRSHATALVVAALAIAPGATSAIEAQEICVENPLAGIERPPRDQSACGSLGATIRAVGAAFFEDCSSSNPAVSKKYSEMAGRYAGLPPNLGLPLLAAEFTAEVGKDSMRCAVRAIVQEGLPWSAETRAELVTLLNGLFEVQDISELIDDVAAGGPLGAVEKRRELAAKLQKELQDRVVGYEDLERTPSAYESLKSKLYTSIISHQSQAESALAAAESGLAACAIDQTKTKLREAVTAGRKGLVDALYEIRSAERAAECWEDRLRQQYGADWNLRLAVIAGPTLNEYHAALDERALLETKETALRQTLVQAGGACPRLRQQVAVHQRVLGHYADAQSRAEAALAAGPCDLSAAEDALQTLRNLEGGLCSNQLGLPVSVDIEARIAARRAERRTTEACAEDAPTGGATQFSGAWQCPERGTITFTVSGSAVTGSVQGRPGEHWGAGQRAGGSIKGTVEGRTLQLVMESGDGTTSKLTATLALDGRSFSGPWEWFRDQNRLANGTWSCRRPPG